MSSIFDGLASTFVQVLGDNDPFTYTKSGGSPVEIYGILEMPSLIELGAADSAGVVTAACVLSVAADDLPDGYGEGDAVVARGVSYRTQVPMPDGRGMVRIPLTRA